MSQDFHLKKYNVLAQETSYNLKVLLGLVDLFAFAAGRHPPAVQTSHLQLINSNCLAFFDLGALGKARESLFEI